MMKLRLVLLIFLACLWSNIVAAAPAPEAKEVPEEVSEYVEIPPISVAMYNKRKRPAGTMTVQMQLKIDDENQRAVARKIMPRLKNAYMQETLKLALNFFDINRPVNANILGRSLQNVTNQVLKHDQARLLIGDIAVSKR